MNSEIPSPEIQFTVKAEADLDDIASFTRQKWGQTHANFYFSFLTETFATLADTPLTGAPYTDAHPDWHRLEHQSHVILYVPTEAGVRIQRVLHNRRKPLA
jgi:toxin ParE1/3/4